MKVEDGNMRRIGREDSKMRRIGREDSKMRRIGREDNKMRRIESRRWKDEKNWKKMERENLDGSNFEWVTGLGSRETDRERERGDCVTSLIPLLRRGWVG